MRHEEGFIEPFPLELKLLLSIIGVDNDELLPKKIIGASSDVDWNKFLELAMHHRVYPQLYVNLKRYGCFNVPEEIVGRLWAAYRNNTLRMLRMASEMESIVRSFDEQRVKSLVLKGPVLAKALYGEISLRTSKDLDILVPRENVGDADRILSELGYVSGEVFGQKESKNKVRNHHQSYIHPQKEIEIELHWRLNREVGREPLFQELWERKQLGYCMNWPVYRLGDEDLFFSLVTHGARHGWFRLRWLTDIHYLVKRPLQWDVVISDLSKFGYQHEGAQALILSEQLFKTPVAVAMTGIMEHPTAIRLAKLSSDLIRRSVGVDTRYALAIRKPSQKLAYLLKLLLPKPWDVSTLPLPRKLYFLYIPLRPFLWVWRYVQKESNRGVG